MKPGGAAYVPILSLFAGMAFFGSATPVSKLVGEDFPLVGAAGARLLIASVVLLPFALWKSDNLFRIDGRDWLLIGGVAIIGNIGFSVLMLYGMRMVSGVAGSIVMSVTPAVTAFGAVLFLSESINPRKVFALALGVAGVLFIHVFSGGNESAGNLWLGSLLVFAAICCEACYTLMGKVVTDSVTPLKLATLSALVAGLLMLPWVIWEASSLDLRSITTDDWLGLGWWGIGTMALGSLLWYLGVSRVPGHVAAAFMAVMPVSALVLSYVLLGESFRWLHVGGFGLALGGVLLMILEHQKQHPQ